MLVRLKFHVPLQNEKGEPLSLVELARGCPEDGPLDMTVWTIPDDKEGLPAIKARVIITRRSPEAEEKGRRELRREAKKKGYTPSKESLEAQGYLFLLTTLSAEILPADTALRLYRLRWQVEICFKRQKSVLALDQIRAKTPELVETVVNAKLLAILWLEEAQWQWAQGFLAEVPDPDAVRVPQWRMMRVLMAGLLLAVGIYLTTEEWLEAPASVRRRLTEAPRKRTRERNEQLRAVLGHLEAKALG